MKKKLYDFSTATAVIVASAYVLLIFISVYFLVTGDTFSWITLAFVVFFVISFAMVLWYYVFMAITVTEKGVQHGRKFIYRKDLEWVVQHNHRLRYDEIIMRDKRMNLARLSRKDLAKREIIVQRFPKYEAFLKEYIAYGIAGKKDDSDGKA